MNEDADSKLSSKAKPDEVPLIWKKKMSTWFQRWDVDGDGILTRDDFEILSNRMAEACRSHDTFHS